MTMKIKTLLCPTLVAVFLSVLTPLGAAEKEPMAAKAGLPRLQLSVDIPPNWEPFLADDTARSFSDRVREVFRRRGYAGEIEFLYGDEPKQNIPTLAIRLITWRLGRTDNAECTFVASLNANGEEHNLGTFENTAFILDRTRGRWGLSNAIDEAAEGALRDLAVKLAKAGLVPGFPPAKM